MDADCHDHRSDDGKTARATEGDEERVAKEAGLVYVSDDAPGITRRSFGSRFAYYDRGGKLIVDEKVLARINSLAVPPAYREVWICSSPNGHIQATGRDARGRKQYRYHPSWTQARDKDKYDHLVEFAEALPALRARMDRDMRRRGLSREKVLATVASLLDTTLIRVGNESYAQTNHSYGLTTLRNRHADIDHGKLRLRFKGKSGKAWNLTVADRRIVRIVRSCQELPGQHLFEYVDAAGVHQPVSSTDVNDYLREIAARDISAKDFRTWHGTVLAAMTLLEMGDGASPAHARKKLRQAIASVAGRLGNTVAICRKCYVHPDIIACYLECALRLAPPARHRAKPSVNSGRSLTSEESAVLSLLKKRSQISAKAKRSCTRTRHSPSARVRQSVAKSIAA